MREPSYNCGMTNTQLFVSICIPVFFIVLGFIWNAKTNRAEIATLRGEVNVLRAEMNGKFDVIAVQLAAINRTLEIIQQDLKRFNEVTTSIDKRLEAVENRR